MVSIFSIMSLFGLSWIFAAFTVTVREIRLPSQVLFTVFSSFQGFGIFIFFCVTSREARESWKELLSCGKYRSEVLRPSKFTLRSYEHRVQAFGTLSSKAAGTLKSEAVSSNYTSKCNNVKSLTMTTMLSSSFSDTVQTSLLDCSSTFTESPVILTPVDIIPSPKDFEEMPTKVVGDDLFIQDPSQENGPVSDKTSATCEPEETTTTSSVDDSYILKPKITRTTTARSLHEIEEAKLDFVDADDSSNGEPVLIDWERRLELWPHRYLITITKINCIHWLMYFHLNWHVFSFELAKVCGFNLLSCSDKAAASQCDVQDARLEVLCKKAKTDIQSFSLIALFFLKNIHNKLKLP